MSSPLSLLEVLADIPDPRHRRGIRHPLPAILGLAVVAMLTGCKSYQAIAQFGRDKGFALAHVLGFRRGKTPTKATYSLLFRRLDVVAFEAAMARWIATRLSEEEMAVLALDGKTLRGSRDGVVPGQHLVAAYAVAAAAVLTQVRVDAKTNEHKAALQLLGIVPVRGRILTGDALFCQRDLCRKILDEGGDYVFTVKDNQPSLVIDIQAGLNWQDQQRRQAALFSPQRGAGCAVGGQHSHDDGQRARPTGEADAAANDDLDEDAGLGRSEAGVRVDARADRAGSDDAGDGLWNHQFERRASRCQPLAGVDARALGDRERPALQAGRDVGGRCESGTPGGGAAGDGRVAQQHPPSAGQDDGQPGRRRADHEQLLQQSPDASRLAAA
jgi:hypothetical protein